MNIKSNIASDCMSQQKVPQYSDEYGTFKRRFVLCMVANIVKMRIKPKKYRKGKMEKISALEQK